MRPGPPLPCSAPPCAHPRLQIAISTSMRHLACSPSLQSTLQRVPLHGSPPRAPPVALRLEGSASAHRSGGTIIVPAPPPNHCSCTGMALAAAARTVHATPAAIQPRARAHNRDKQARSAPSWELPFDAMLWLCCLLLRPRLAIALGADFLGQNAQCLMTISLTPPAC